VYTIWETAVIIKSFIRQKIDKFMETYLQATSMEVKDWNMTTVYAIYCKIAKHVMNKQHQV
jgi:hypothetical protein